MLARTPLRDLAIAWLEAQDPNEIYDWCNPFKCACAQMADALDRKDEWLVPGADGFASLRKRTQDWYDLNVIARGNVCGGEREEWTFGAFLRRLKSQDD